MEKIYIYYDCTPEEATRIEQRFGFPHGQTINGESLQPVTVKPEDWELLRETEKRGYIKIRIKK